MSAVLAVLLAILKIVGIVLLALLALLLVALVLPAGIAFTYIQPEGVAVRLCYGPVRLTLYPRRAKAKKNAEQKRGSRKKQGAGQGSAPPEAPSRSGAGKTPLDAPAPNPPEAQEAAPAPATARTEPPQAASVEWAEPAEQAEQAPPPQPEAPPQPDPSKPRAEPEEKGKAKPKEAQGKDEAKPEDADPGLVERIRAAALADPVAYAGRAFDLLGTCGGPLLRRMQVRGLRVYWTVTGSDAAETGIRYGKTIAALNTILCIAREHLRVQADELRLEPDFTGEQKHRRAVSFRILTRPLYLVVTAVRMVWRFWHDPVLLPPKPKKPKRRKHKQTKADA